MNFGEIRVVCRSTVFVRVTFKTSIFLILFFYVFSIRRKSTQKAGTNGNVKKTDQQEEIDDKLPDNVLYVPAGEFDSTGGNYSTTDVDKANSTE